MSPGPVSAWVLMYVGKALSGELLHLGAHTFVSIMLEAE